MQLLPISQNSQLGQESAGICRESTDDVNNSIFMLESQIWLLEEPQVVPADKLFILNIVYR